MSRVRDSTVPDTFRLISLPIPDGDKAKTPLFSQHKGVRKINWKGTLVTLWHRIAALLLLGSLLAGCDKCGDFFWQDNGQAGPPKSCHGGTGPSGT